jgi:hypothetical protein
LEAGQMREKCYFTLKGIFLFVISLYACVRQW